MAPTSDDVSRPELLAFAVVIYAAACSVIELVDDERIAAEVARCTDNNWKHAGEGVTHREVWDACWQEVHK